MLILDNETSLKMKAAVTDEMKKGNVLSEQKNRMKEKTNVIQVLS